jgi:hypothetical protein
MNKQFVLSKTGFTDIKKAEAKVTNWYENGSLKTPNVKLYKVVEVYDLKLKFVKRKTK